jgi:hypothetical protein
VVLHGTPHPEILQYCPNLSVVTDEKVSEPASKRVRLRKPILPLFPTM